MEICDANVLMQLVTEENSIARSTFFLLVHAGLCHEMGIPKFKHKMQTYETCKLRLENCVCKINVYGFMLIRNVRKRILKSFSFFKLQNS